MSEVPLLLIPGFLADTRQLSSQRNALSYLRIIDAELETNGKLGLPTTDWMQVQADRWVERHLRSDGTGIDIRQPYFLGGVAIGGMLAVEAALRMAELGHPPAGLLLISSCRDWTAVPPWYARWCGLARWLPSGLSQAHYRRWHLPRPASEPALPAADRQHIKAMARACSGSRMIAEAQCCASWRRERADLLHAPFEIYQLHGRLDPLLPLPAPREATLVHNAGAALVLSHATAVNNWIDSIIADFRLQYSGARLRQQRYSKE